MADTDQPEAYPATVLLVYNKCGTHAERAVDSLATALEREGFRLYCVHEAREAVAAYSTMVPEVVSVLVDWDLKTNEKHDNSSNPSLAMPPSSSQHQQQQQRRTHVPKHSKPSIIGALLDPNLPVRVTSEGGGGSSSVASLSPCVSPNLDRHEASSSNTSTSTNTDDLGSIATESPFAELDRTFVAKRPHRRGARKVVHGVRSRNDSVPLFILTDRHSLATISVSLLHFVTGYFWKTEDSPKAIAHRVRQAADNYRVKLTPPFFRALRDYTEDDTYRWHTPGHFSGQAFLKSPAGREFHSFLGHNVFKADLSVSVPQLGSLLEHSGVAGEAERYAARVFGADHTFFVLNGTSSANKMVSCGIVTPGDIVVIDRNCHKSLCHAMQLTGAVPVYLQPTRNHLGIIGGILPQSFTPEAVQQLIDRSPLVQRCCAPGAANRRPKLLVVTNSTYDGLIYNVERICAQLGDSVPYLHFDEAWFAYACFNPLYNKRHALWPDAEPIGSTSAGAAYYSSDDTTTTTATTQVGPTMFATQSTHKLLAALSQAAMLHVKKGAGAFDFERFNESYMMHSSTSPQYVMVASLDVATKMMDGRGGRVLTQDSIDEAVAFRQKMVAIAHELQSHGVERSRQWWFGVWQPESFSPATADDEAEQLLYKLDRKMLATSQSCWLLDDRSATARRTGHTWHGFENNDGFMMLDPIKVTITTPGTLPDGSLDTWGIPAPIVAKYLTLKGIVDEKTGFYTFLLLHSIGVYRGQSSVLLHALFQFKQLYDDGEELASVLPELVRSAPDRYRQERRSVPYTLRSLCDEMHGFLRDKDMPRAIIRVFALQPVQVLTPREAYNALVRGATEHVPIDKLMGRVVAVMLVPYPPGIAIIMPGERITAETQPVVDFLRELEAFDNMFPGFETEVHGVRIEYTDTGKRFYTVSCILESQVESILASSRPNE